MRSRTHIQRPDTGATLALVLAYVLVVTLIVGALSGWIANDLKNSAHFANARKTQFALNSAMNVGIENIRYNPLVGSNQTLNATPPSYCWGTSAPSTVSNIDTYSEDVWCSTAWTPASTTTRVVTLDACPTTMTSTQCAASPSLQAIVNFDDYPQTGYTLGNTLCTSTCGSEMILDSWIYSGSLANALGYTVSTAPTSVSATFASSSSTSVSWSAPASNGGSPITSYTAVATDTTNSIYSGQSCTVSATTCVITNLNPGDTYTVVVYTTNGAGNSNASSPPATVTAFAPGAPTGVTGTAGITSASISWTAPASNGGAPITGYTATSSPGGYTCTTTSTSCTVNNLTAGVSYTFTVTATNSAGTSAASAPSGTVVPLSSALYTFTVGTSVTFTPGGATGMTGPTLAQSLSGLSSNASLAWDSNTSYYNDSAGYQTWTVPATGCYQITAAGAAGGLSSTGGGEGNIVTGTVCLTQGQVVEILVGQTGGVYSGQGGGGGGGTFVVPLGNPSYPYMIGGGGGGGGGTGAFGSASTTGNNGVGDNPTVGVAGPNGALGGGDGNAGGGSGLTGNGAGAGNNGESFTNGGSGSGGSGGGPDGGDGGFGGGGGAWLNSTSGPYDRSGGGGGYGGGGAGAYGGGYANNSGGGGSSFVSGTSTNTHVGYEAGNGYVTILRTS